MALPRRLAALAALLSIAVSVNAADLLPSVVQTIAIRSVRVTLLDARRLSVDEFRRAAGDEQSPWAGGGLRMAFLVENSPGEPTPPVIGEVRVLFAAELYNSVTNASSSKPFAPTIIVRDVHDFYATEYGQRVRVREPRAGTTAAVLDVFIRGASIPAGSSGIVEIEQGETHQLPPDGNGRPRALSADDVSYKWFRFRLPVLD